MSWIRERPLAALAALALILRVACAIATEINPLFPAYYYTDANRFHAAANRALRDVHAGREPLIDGALGDRIHIFQSLTIYRVFGPTPLAAKLFNALLGALAVSVFAWALSMVFPVQAALAAGFALAVWPSHVFYTSQNLKEAPGSLLAYAALGAVLVAGFDDKTSRRQAAAFALSAALVLFGAGSYRSYVMICMGSAFVLALFLKASRPPRTNALLTAAVLIVTLAVYPSASSALLGSFRAEPLGEADQGRIQSHLIPITYSADSLTISRPTSPEGISRFRRDRQAADRKWAAAQAHRKISTQVYPDETFKTWLDVLLYLPKGAFTVLFMPLPGLYPMDGKIGRWAAAGENIFLLLLAVLGLVGVARGPRTPARFGLLALFSVMAAGAALLEFDLGSAGRHKLLYLPMLFPFAAEEALRLYHNRAAK